MRAFGSTHPLWKPMPTAQLIAKIRRSTRAEELPVTDVAGRYSLAVDRSKSLALAIVAEGYLPDAKVWQGTPPPESHTFVLRPAGAVHGTVVDPMGPNRFELRVTLTKSRGYKPALTRTYKVDAKGRFFAPELELGRWRAAIARTDVTSQRPDEREKRYTNPIPVLDAAAETRNIGEIDVTAGGPIIVHLIAPTAGAIEGVVSAADGPVADATVWAVAKGAKPLSFGRNRETWDSPNSSSYAARLTTGKDGRFRFLYNAPRCLGFSRQVPQLRALPTALRASRAIRPNDYAQHRANPVRRSAAGWCSTQPTRSGPRRTCIGWPRPPATPTSAQTTRCHRVRRS